MNEDKDNEPNCADVPFVAKVPVSKNEKGIVKMPIIQVKQLCKQLVEAEQILIPSNLTWEDRMIALSNVSRAVGTLKYYLGE